MSPVEEGGPGKAVYRILNMDCPMEETLIRKKLSGMPGIESLAFNLMQRVLVVRHTLEDTGPIEAALRSVGMAPEPVTGRPGELPQQSGLSRHIMAAALAVAVGSELTELFLGASWWWLTLGLALGAIALGGLSTYRKGWIALKNRNLNMNALMSVAVTGALLIGQYPEAAMVMVLFTVAEDIEARSLSRARRAIGDLLRLAPEMATVLQPDGSWRDMESRSVPVGSTVRVRPGGRVALDGTVSAGSSTVNQAPITGESLPVDKAPGDPVFAGTINESGSLEFRTTALASHSTLARIIDAVEAAQNVKAPMQRFVDRFAAVYTPAVFGVAVLLATVPPLLFGGAWLDWLYKALVLLVIACPCALVISTPVSIVSALAAATRHGLLIKGGVFLEQGRRLTRLALDKTGTLTWGKPELVHMTTLDAAPSAASFTLAASLAARSDHPVSRALAEAAGRRNIALREVTGFRALPGLGIEGTVDGALWRLGNDRLAASAGLESPDLKNTVLEQEKLGRSVVLLMGPQGVAALYSVADGLRPSSIEAIADLRQLGVRTVMLTGDNHAAAAIIAGQAGVDDMHAALLPEEKRTIVTDLVEQGRGLTGMVGDGINDAPALAAADIGFAMGAAGSDSAIETADVALMDDDLRKIPYFIRLSRSTHAILMQNIVLALGIKAVFLALAVAGQATMWMAVFADLGTSFLVVGNGLRLLRN